MFTSVKHIHFVGIGGIGMSGIAEILLTQGFFVSGSDLSAGENTERLKELGARIFKGHSAENIDGAEAVVYSSAVKPSENPETLEALHRKIPILRRAEMLAEVARLTYCLGIAGTHGKTTTTSLCGLMMMKAGLDPTVLVGGRLRGFGGTNARLGKGEWTVLEADEYDRSFLQLAPTIAVLTNVEADHLDIYSGLDDIKKSMLEFANKIPFYGVAVVCLDDPGVKDILGSIKKKVVTYGTSPHCDVRAKDISFKERTSECSIFHSNVLLGTLRVNVPGMHNVLNALAAVSVGLQLGLEFSIIAEAIAEFGGVYRRFEFKGEKDGVMVVDDYAHHPTEVRATLQAARAGWDRRVLCVFQPHTFSRTRDFAREFGQSFEEADVLIVTDVYAAREDPIEGITGEIIANSAREAGHRNVHYVPNFGDILSTVESLKLDGDMILTLGAGDIWKVSNELVK